MPCRPPRPAKSSSTDWPTRLVIGPLQGYRRPDLENRNATAAVIGAGDFIGAAIAKKFASAGFTVFAGRRHGDKLAPPQLASNAAERNSSAGHRQPSLLAGLLFDGDGNRMTPSHAVK